MIVSHALQSRSLIKKLTSRSLLKKKGVGGSVSEHVTVMN